MTLEQIIAEHDQTNTDGGCVDGCACGWMYGYWDAPETFSCDDTVAKWAAHVAAEIRKAFGVVELPEPDDEDDEGQIYFGSVRVDLTSHHGPQVWSGDVFVPPALLRTRAAQYLAAAKAAGAVDGG